MNPASSQQAVALPDPVNTDVQLSQAVESELALHLDSTPVRAALKLKHMTVLAVDVLERAINDGYLELTPDPTDPITFDPVTGRGRKMILSGEKRVAAAQDLLNRTPETAPVAKSQVVEDRSLVDADAFTRVKDRWFARQLRKEHAVDASFTEIVDQEPGEEAVGLDIRPGATSPVHQEGDT